MSNRPRFVPLTGFVPLLPSQHFLRKRMRISNRFAVPLSHFTRIQSISDSAGFLLLAKEDRIPCGLTPTVAFLPPSNRQITLYPANSRGIRNFNPTSLLTWAVLISGSFVEMTVDIFMCEPVVAYRLFEMSRWISSYLVFLPFCVSRDYLFKRLLLHLCCLGYMRIHTQCDFDFFLLLIVQRSPSALHRPLWLGWRRRRMMINNKTGDQQRWIEDEKEKGKFIFSGGGERFRRKVAPQQGLPHKSHIQIGQCTDWLLWRLTHIQPGPRSITDQQQKRRLTIQRWWELSNNRITTRFRVFGDCDLWLIE